MAYLRLVHRHSVSEFLDRLKELQAVGGTHEDYLRHLMTEMGLSEAAADLFIDELVEAGIFLRHPVPVEEMN